MLLQVLYSVRSERLMERVQYNLLFRWFIGLSMENSVWAPTVFSKNRQRLIEHDAVVAFFNEVLAQTERKNWVSQEHFSVDGTLIPAWANYRSFVRKGAGDDSDGDGRAGAKTSAAGRRAATTRTNSRAIETAGCIARARRLASCASWALVDGQPARLDRERQGHKGRWPHGAASGLEHGERRAPDRPAGDDHARGGQGI